MFDAHESTNTQPILIRDAATPSLGVEPAELAEEIVQELLAHKRLEAANSRTIAIGPANSDLRTREEVAFEKVRRLRRLVASGEYNIDPMEVAVAMLDSGDFQ